VISIEAAEALARAAHEYQVTSLGEPRFDHVMRVAAEVSDSGDHLTTVAVPGAMCRPPGGSRRLTCGTS
jgi:(p)ppGpp synthase/HD superfamily hydrolase